MATITLDLSFGGTEALVTGTQLAGVTLDFSSPTCATGHGLSPPNGPCRSTDMEAGTDAANVTDPPGPNNPGNLGTSDLVVQAEGPTSVIAGQPFSYTYTITNRGVLDATGVRFEDALPSDLELIAYAPALPVCEQRDEAFSCYLRDLDSGEAITLTLVITGHSGQPMSLALDPLLPGWPICTVLKERTWLHILQCELGNLKSGQAVEVQMLLSAIGVQERKTTNTATVSAREADLDPRDNTITTTLTVQVSAGN
jgi:uncharacterized repeat protein (TIGR01451 family)